MKKLVAFILLAVTSTFLGHAAANVLETVGYQNVPTLSISATLFVISGINYLYIETHQDSHKGVAYDITQEIWVKYIVDNLFKQNPHLMNCFNEDDFVLNGAVVHIPQAGSKPTPVKNRGSFPAGVIQRADNDVTYALDVYDVPPTLIRNAEQAELSYNKMDSVYREQVAALAEIIGDDIIYKWRPELAANIIRTTGGAIAAHLDSATGNRKMITASDIKNARTRLNKLNIPKENRFCLISSEMLGQLQEDSVLKQRDVSQELDMKNGVIARLYGFNIIERSSTLVYTNAGTPVAKAIDAIAATTDNDSAICYQADQVAKAQGSVEFFEDLRNPSYYGDIYSALVRMGGRKRRTNGEGVVAIVQDASA